MAQRRSKNRRLSARRSNVSGFLNEDTNVYENDDPMWYDRTAVRPSTSLRLSKHTSAVLDPDSTVHASQLSDHWYENLSQSENSKLLQEAVKSTKNRQNEENADSDRASAATESESEHEFQKKRANLRHIRKPNHQIDKSNAFAKALEKTTDSHTRNLTRNQMLEGNESESTHDDSRTLIKIRPKFARRAKNDTNNFDKALESDSASERPSETSRRSLRSSKRISEVNEDFEFVTPEKQQRLRRSVAEKVVEVSLGNKTVENLQSKSVNKTTETSVRELRNRSVTVPPAESTGKQNSSKRVSVEQSPEDSSSSPEVKRQRRQLFSQSNKSAVEKSKGEKSAFEEALDSANNTQENEATLTEAVSISRRDKENDVPEDNNDDNEEEEADDSDSSSIPKNIRRTRSRSLFGERKSDQTSDVSANKSKSQSPKDPLALDESTASDKQEGSQEVPESSDEEDIYNATVNRSQEEQQEKSNKSQADESQKSSVESSDDEDMIDGDASKSKQSERNESDKNENPRLEVSSVESSDDEDMINMSSSKPQQEEANASNKSKRTSDRINKSRASKSTSSGDKDEDVPTSPEISNHESKTSNRINKSRASKSTSSGDKDDEVPTSPEISNHKSRSRLFQRKSASKGGNAFDDITFNESSVVNNKSKETEIEETPKLSQQSSKVVNKSQKNQLINASKNKSNLKENSKNDSKADVSEDETSTIPTNIRRTRSRLFQKSKAGDDDNAFEDALDADNVPENRSALSQKSRTLNKTTNNKSASGIRDAPSQRSILEALKNKPRIILDKIVRPADPFLVDSSEENQENRQPNRRRSVASKEKSVHKLPEINAPSEQRSVETSSEGTPATPKVASTPFPTPSVATKVLPSKRLSSKPSPAKSVQNSTFDDLLHTPNPAQSTLNPHGKPFTRITQFSYTMPFSDIEERTPIANPAPAPIAEEVVAPKNATIPPAPAEVPDNDDIDVTGESDVSDYPLLTRQHDEIPNDKTTIEEQDEVPRVSQSPKKKAQNVSKEQSVNNNNEAETTIDWDKAKKHTDAIKLMVDAQRRQAEEARKKRELEKQRVDAEIKRLQAQREAEAKRKSRKPIDKAFLVDGKVYKQPKLPRPKPWVTDKLYKYLWKILEPKYGDKARIKSEEFVIQLSDFATRISKRKKFENYSDELDELMMSMAKLGIIETRYDFHRFVSDFLPSSFREKVNPIAQPGNGRNIPFDPELLDRPLLNTRGREDDTDGS